MATESNKTVQANRTARKLPNGLLGFFAWQENPQECLTRLAAYCLRVTGNKPPPRTAQHAARRGTAPSGLNH